MSNWKEKISSTDALDIVDEFINSDFDDLEERKLMRDALFRGFKSLEMM